MVISSISALINAALPKSQDGKAGSKGSKGSLAATSSRFDLPLMLAPLGPSASTRRSQGLQYTMNALQKLAATRNCAVVILSQCATKMQSEQAATLVAAVNAAVWEQGITTRLVLFRDWAWRGKQLASVFLAGLQKLDGKTTDEAVERVSAFAVGPVRPTIFSSFPSLDSAVIVNATGPEWCNKHRLRCWQRSVARARRSATAEKKAGADGARGSRQPR